jgi:hypothetical protein
MSISSLNNNESSERVQGGTDSTIPPRADVPSNITMEDTLMGTDPPIEDAHPGLQPALVFASYPIVLTILITIFAIYFALSRLTKQNSDDSLPNRVEVTK